MPRSKGEDFKLGHYQICERMAQEANRREDPARLESWYGNQALILHDWGRLDEAMTLHHKAEAICLELGNQNGLQASYGNQAVILEAWGRLDDAMALHKKAEAICLELGNQDSLQRSYGNQALILQAWGRLDEAMALLKKEEAICLAVGNQNSLANCYWNWALLAQGQSDSKTEREKLERALALFIELKMPSEIEAVQNRLENINGNSPHN
jgi:tetratricopeptide (TPR) repeat protein